MCAEDSVPIAANLGACLAQQAVRRRSRTGRRAIPPEDMHLQRLSASIELDSFCTTLFENVVQLGQVLVNGSSRLPYTYCKIKCALLSGAGVFKCPVVQQPALVQQPGTCIRAVKNRDAAYYPEHRKD